MKKFYTDKIEKSERITRLVENLFKKMPEVESARAVLLTESYKQTENEPMKVEEPIKEEVQKTEELKKAEEVQKTEEVKKEVVVEPEKGKVEDNDENKPLTTLNEIISPDNNEQKNSS